MNEPNLIQGAYLKLTHLGRLATKNAYRRFGYALPDERDGDGPGQINLFKG
ncbi:MAG: hypothetical protein P8099_20715 [Gemmatimonadota bacterium]